MSLVDRLLDVDRHDIDDYVPFFVAGRRHGWIRPGIEGVITAHPDVFAVEADRVSLRSELYDYASRTAALHRVVGELHERGMLMGWWDEAHPVVDVWGREPVMEIERGGLDPFGIHSFGVHLNGFVRTPPGGISLWVATRSPEKGTYPGELDHLVAGGQPVGLGLRENMIKECAEEAGIPQDLAERMRAESAISYRCAQRHGLNDDTIFCYDLELPADFEPRSVDGEVASFALWSIPAVIDRLRTTRDFKYNVGPVILDFLVRRRLLPDDDPEQAEVVTILERLRGDARD